MRGGATRAFLFLVFPTLLRLPHHLRAWNRLVDRRYIDLKEEPKAMYKEFRLVKGSILDRLGEKRTKVVYYLRKRYGLHSKIAPLNAGHANNKLVLITV